MGWGGLDLCDDAAGHPENIWVTNICRFFLQYSLRKYIWLTKECFFVAYIRELVKYLAPAFPVVILPSSPPLPRSSMSRWLQVQKWIWLLITFNVNLCCFDQNKAWNRTCVNHNCLSDDRICPTGDENYFWTWQKVSPHLILTLWSSILMSAMPSSSTSILPRSPMWRTFGGGDE